MKDELPASLVKEKAKRGIGTHRTQSNYSGKSREQPFAADKRLLRAQRIVPSSCAGLFCGLFWSLFGRFFRHCRLSKGEFVGGFERRSTNAADDSGAIAADQRIGYFASTNRTPQANVFGCGWIRRLLFVHSEDERSTMAIASARP